MEVSCFDSLSLYFTSTKPQPPYFLCFFSTALNVHFGATSIADARASGLPETPFTHATVPSGWNLTHNTRVPLILACGSPSARGMTWTTRERICLSDRHRTGASLLSSVDCVEHWQHCGSAGLARRRRHLRPAGARK